MDAVYNKTGDASLEHPCDWMSYYTHHSDTEVHQHVHVDVPLGGPVAWMFYYTHHSNTDAPQYVHVDELSDCPVS
jgi:hypothetical protein